MFVSSQETEFKHSLTTQLIVLLRDDDTKYLQLLANGRHRKTRIFQLEQDEGLIAGYENLKSYITNYYKQLFGPPVSNNFNLDEGSRGDIPQVSALENEVLSHKFTEKEINDAIFWEAGEP